MFVSSEAQAYNYGTCGGNPIKWNEGWTNMSLLTVSMPVGSVWDSRLQNAMWHWNNVKGSSFVFYVCRDTDGSIHLATGSTRSIGIPTMSGSTLAVTSTRYHCYWQNGWQFGIDETDLGFNSNRSWTTGTYNYDTPNAAPYSFEGVALHEFGHVMGLDHDDRWMATLNSFYPNSGPLGSTREWDPFSDDRLGARALYWDGTTEVDIAGSALKRTGAGTSNLVSSPAWAVRGSNVTMEFTFLNQSTSTRTFDIGYLPVEQRRHLDRGRAARHELRRVGHGRLHGHVLADAEHPGLDCAGDLLFGIHRRPGQHARREQRGQQHPADAADDHGLLRQVGAVGRVGQVGVGRA